jgi:hypothetical protein
LKGIVGVAGLVQDRAADTKHHRPVAFHHGPKRELRGFVVSRLKAFQKLPVRQPAD